MALPPVGNSPTVTPNTQASSAAPTFPVKLGVDGTAKTEDIGKALQKFGLDEGTGKAFAGQLEGIQAKSSRTAVLNKVEKNMNEWAKSHPGASKEEVVKETRKQLTTQTLMTKHIEKSITDMAQKSIERMRDTFSDS